MGQAQKTETEAPAGYLRIGQDRGSHGESRAPFDILRRALILPMPLSLEPSRLAENWRRWS